MKKLFELIKAKKETIRKGGLIALGVISVIGLIEVIGKAAMSANLDDEDFEGEEVENDSDENY